MTGVLGLSGSPYLVEGTLTVPDGGELVIQPGVEILFKLDTIFAEDGRIDTVELGSIVVYGSITAVGSEATPITFTSARKYPGRGDWDGIWMIDADEGSQFEYCRFLFGAKYGTRYHYGQFDSTVWDYGSLTLVRSSPTVRRSWFLAGGFHGVHCDTSSDPLVENCVFYDNAGHGIYVHWSSDPQLRYNIIIENDDYGVFCKESGDAPRPDLQLDYNIVWSNFSGEFSQHAPSTLGRVIQANGNLDSCDYRFNLRLNPDFADAEMWDFRLNSCSAAIDAGPEDNGLRDPDGTRIELGIYPYTYRPGEIRRRVTVERLETARSPYYMSCDVLLPVGQTLTVEPGVEVQVEGRYIFRVRGRLLVQGSEAAPVSFISAARMPEKGDWFGLVLESGGDPGCEFSYTDIAHARWGVRLDSRDAVIDHCRISYCDSVGIFCNNSSAPTVTDCELIDNSIAGVICQFNSSPTLRRNIIRGGEGYGILAREYSRPVITNNIIDGVRTNGIRLENLSHAIIIYQPDGGPSVLGSHRR